MGALMEQRRRYSWEWVGVIGEVLREEKQEFGTLGGAFSSLLPTSESADGIRGKNFNGFLQAKGGDLC